MPTQGSHPCSLDALLPRDMRTAESEIATHPATAMLQSCPTARTNVVRRIRPGTTLQKQLNKLHTSCPDREEQGCFATLKADASGRNRGPTSQSARTREFAILACTLAASWRASRPISSTTLLACWPPLSSAAGLFWAGVAQRAGRNAEPCSVLQSQGRCPRSSRSHPRLTLHCRWRPRRRRGPAASGKARCGRTTRR